jgi:2-polyprenyl-3-methyl-5-hydroxy-6-metoxy-1,4-benzoquinol methylase
MRRTGGKSGTGTGGKAGTGTETEARLALVKEMREPCEMREACMGWFRSHYPQIAGGLLFSVADRDPDLDRHAEAVLGFLARKREAEGGSMDGALEGVARMSFDFLRLQPRFMKTGRYRAARSEPVRERIYARQEVMEGYYLDGLLLTYAFWVNHAALYRYFVRTFLPRLPRAPRVLEIGVGHGLMALTLLRELPEALYQGVDISPFSLDYAARLLSANGVDLSRASLREEDAAGPAAVTGQECDAVLCCEVLEHVEDPAALLRTVRRRLRPDGLAFVTTVANVEADDHIYRFEDEAHIRRVVEAAGLRVASELALPLRGYETARPRPLNYAAVLAPAGAGAGAERT